MNTLNGMIRKTLAIILLSAVGLGILAAAVFYATGGRSFTIQTPSMGEYAPVGTTAFSTRVDFNELKVGDTILFNPPASKEKYFHRIAKIDSAGIRTKGDNNPSIDPWTLKSSNILGKEAFHVVGLGWFIRALPILIIGGILIWTVTHYYVRRKIYVFPARVISVSFLFALSAAVIKPFVRAAIITQTVKDGKAYTSFVPTGIFGVTGTSKSGGTGTGRPGQIVNIVTDHASQNGRFNIELGLHLDFWGWVLLVFIWSIPLLLTIGYVLMLKRLHPEEFVEPVESAVQDASETP
jgi:signal peptidase I